MTIKTSGYSNRVRLQKREQRCAEGKLRNERWRSLTLIQKLNELDDRLGCNGCGAVKQRRRINYQILYPSGTP
jgi:hypothetical protein